MLIWGKHYHDATYKNYVSFFKAAIQLAVDTQPYNNTSSHLNWYVDWRDLHNSLYVLTGQYEMCAFLKGPQGNTVNAAP